MTINPTSTPLALFTASRLAHRIKRHEHRIDCAEVVRPPPPIPIPRKVQPPNSFNTYDATSASTPLIANALGPATCAYPLGIDYIVQTTEIGDLTGMVFMNVEPHKGIAKMMTADTAQVLKYDNNKNRF